MRPTLPIVTSNIYVQAAEHHMEIFARGRKTMNHCSIKLGYIYRYSNARLGIIFIAKIVSRQLKFPFNWLHHHFKYEGAEPYHFFFLADWSSVKSYFF